MKTARDRLVRLLDDSKPAGSFSAQLHAPAPALELEVSGVGRVSLPVRAPLARKLIAVARPAMFGQGEQTITDVAVRDTWEITPDQITLGGADWNALLSRALEHFRDELGLPATSRLRAEPHSMLVYGKGQFFLPHQDSEKDDAMVGTLVVSLPSAHTGGELMIEHAGETRTYWASKDELTLVAFYADCRHQVTRVRSGYRIALTFNLLAHAETPAPDADPDAELASCLIEHFATPATTPYGGRDLGPPNRLVLFLDHEYTQRGLAWQRLKGVDAERAARVRAAAEQAGCETVLALAEVRETWNALPSGGGDMWHVHDYYEDEEEDDDGSDGPNGGLADYDVNELIDEQISLDWWTSPDGAGGERISLHVAAHEACAATPSVSLVPYRSEYEGYMGNYGNTLDRWYRRAAIVVWPQSRAFAARAEAGSQWALDELLNRIADRDLMGARTAADSLSPFWTRAGAQPGLLLAALNVSAGLGAAATAAMLLEPFRVEMVAQQHAGGLAAAAGQYGEAWTRGVIDGWFGTSHQFGPDLSEWVDGNLPALCGALRTAGAPEVARLLAAGAWRWAAGQIRYWAGTARSEIREPRLGKLGSPLARLLEVADDRLRDEIAGMLRECGDSVLECVMPALRLAKKRRVGGLATVARDCEDRLATIVARPARAHDDWSIDWSGCGCGVCDTLGAFLGSRSQRDFAWPLATPGRGHVHTQIDSAGLPVRHKTRRQGRPYTLVLTKTDDLFTRAVDAHDRAVTDLAWLTTARFPSTRPDSLVVGD